MASRPIANRERLLLLGHYETHAATGLPYDRKSGDQQWLLKQGYLTAEIDHHPVDSDWPRIVLKITEAGRAAFRTIPS